MMKKLLFSIAVAAVGATIGAGENTGTVSYTQYAKMAKKEFPLAYPEEVVEYQGFSIARPAESRWGIVRGAQRSGQALWAVVDKGNKLHTILATVKLSPPMPEKLRKDLTPAKFREALEKSISKNPQNRMKQIRVKSRNAEVNGVKGIELFFSALDCGSKFASAEKPLKLKIRSFNAITADGRVFSVSVSERIPDSNAEADDALAGEFINAVKLK